MGLAESAGVALDPVRDQYADAGALYAHLFAWHAAQVTPQLLRLANLEVRRGGALYAALMQPDGSWHVKVVLDLVSKNGRGFGPYREPGVYELTIDVEEVKGHGEDEGDRHLLRTWTYELASMIRLAAGYKPPKAEFTE